MNMPRTDHVMRRLGPVLLVIILVSAAGLRFYNLSWDNGTFAHPDERSTVAFYAPTMRWPTELGQFLDPRASTLNPFWDITQQQRRSYTYGHFPLYTLVLVAELLHWLARWPGLPPEWVQFLATANTPTGYALVGRALVALSDLFTVYLVFLLGRRWYGQWGGLLAAALSALTVLQIQLAHFFAVDPISTTFTLLALYGAVQLSDRPSKWAAVLSGVGIGLAVASKFSALPIAFAPIVAAYFASVQRQPRPPQNTDPQAEIGVEHREPQSPSSISAPRSPVSMVGLTLLALMVALVIFALTSPFVLLDFQNFWQAVIEEQGNMVSGVADFPFTRQYRHTPAYWYYIEQQLRWGMGWPLGLLALAGTGWVVFKAARGQAQPGEWISLGWIILYFGPTGLFLAKFMRYMIPVVPLFTLFGVGWVVALWQWRSRSAYEPISAVASQPGASPPLITEPTDGQPPAAHLSSPPLRRSATFRLDKLTRLAALLIAVIVLGSTAFWAVAFVNGVYGSEHTWGTFARWVYANVPDHSCVAWEHWDDRMPVDLPEPNANPGAHHYFQPQLPMYEEDTQPKYEGLRSTLMNCDYIVLATNRLYRTIPRLPERYPMSTRYYQALFSGELGFEQIYSAETPPQLGPFKIDDQAADESFTVYDHPKPILFKKTRQLSAAEWDALLGHTWQGAIPGYVGSPTLLMRLRGAGNTPQAAALTPEQGAGKSLMLDTPVEQLPVVDDFRWNSLANNSTLVAVLFWWLVIMLIGLVTWPITFWLCHHLPDRGYGFNKSLGLLLVSYLVWLPSSLGWLGNTTSTAIIALILISGLSLWVVNNQRQSLRQFWQANWRLILVSEAVFGLVYLYFIGLRLLNPDLWQPWLGGEKMLEIGFLNAIVKSAHMPPYDPFFAGGIMNYYYYGLFIVGVLIKLTGIQPSLAFNLAVPSLAALTAINVFTLAGNLSPGPRVSSKGRTDHLAMLQAPLSNPRYILSGLMAVLLVLFIGNLEGAAQFLRELGKLSQSDFQSAIPGLQTLVLAGSGLKQVIAGAPLAPYNYWDPTRVIPATINEFPYFSFLFADLHPHMIGIPFTVLLLGLAYNWLNQSLPLATSRQTSKIEEIPDQEPAPEKQLAPLSQLSFTHSFTNSVADFTQFFVSALTRPLASSFMRWLALPFVLGAIAAINTWDLPTYLGLVLAGFLIGRYRQEQEPLTLNRAFLLLASGAFLGGVLLAATYLLYAPFFAHYQPPAETGLGIVHTQTALDQHLKIWGFFLFILISWLWFSLLYLATRNSFLRALSLGLRRWNVWPHLHEIYNTVVQRQSESAQVAQWGLGLVIIVALTLGLLGYGVPAYLVPLVALALVLLFRREVPAETAYVGILTFTGLLILLGVEFFFLRDFLGGAEYFRMNTLFKFYIQVWVIFALVSAVVLPWLWQWSEFWSLPALLLWRSALAVLVLATLIYPTLATRTRVDDRFPGDFNRPPIGTLDGLAYMNVGVFEWPMGSPIQLKYDYEAIRWLQEHVPGTPIIAEAKVGYYREGGMRVAAYTGLPSILGGLHQNEQRYAWQVGDRDFLVSEFWASPDPARTLQLMDQLGISYVYVGQVERITHGAYVQSKFEQLQAQGALELVFANEQTKIYKRVRS
jgi:uncharacterized membrane protein